MIFDPNEFKKRFKVYASEKPVFNMNGFSANSALHIFAPDSASQNEFYVEAVTSKGVKGVKTFKFKFLTSETTPERPKSLPEIAGESTNKAISVTKTIEEVD